MQKTDAQAWPEGEAPVSPRGREFLAYWHSKCPAGGYPRRSNISPPDMLSLLPYIFMVDVLRDGKTLDFQFRLVGTGIVSIEGEHTGKRLGEMFPDRKAFKVLWRQYCDATAGRIWVRHESLRWQGRDHVVPAFMGGKDAERKNNNRAQRRQKWHAF
jgi:hypothetical protein